MRLRRLRLVFSDISCNYGMSAVELMLSFVLQWLYVVMCVHGFVVVVQI